MIEMVLVLPVVLLLLALTFFFGWAMDNQQRVITAARYASWKSVYQRHGVSGERLDEAFFQGRQAAPGADYGGGPDQTRVDYVDEAYRASSEAGDLVDHLVNGLPRGSVARARATFATGHGVWSRFEGAIRRTHGRDGVEWRRGQAWLAGTLREGCFRPLDDALDGVEAPGDDLAEQVRRLYSAHGGW
jgi:hypothetical protein